MRILHIIKIVLFPIYNYIKWAVNTSILLFKYPLVKIGKYANIINTQLRKSTVLKIGDYSVLNNVKLGNYNYFAANVQFSGSEIGNYSYLGKNTRIVNAQIGKFTCIGPNVNIGLAKHPTDTFVSLHPAFFSKSKQVGVTFVDNNVFSEIPEKVLIGNDVWIGANVIITHGVVVGDGAIIAAGSVVTKDIKPYNIVAGIPAKEIRKRFDDNEIKKLLKSKWWNKPEIFLRENIALFHNVEKYCLNIDD